MEHRTDQFIIHKGLKFYDLEGSETLRWTTAEVIDKDEYGLQSIPWASGDVFIDIGANVGTTSIWLASMQPDVQILAIEPSKYNYDNLLRNIALNSIKNIVPLNAAVWCENTSLKMTTNRSNTGASRVFGGDEYARAFTLDWIFEKYGIQKCRYLKMDCEGSEYIICQSPRFSPEYIENVGIEVHRNFPYSTYDLERTIWSKFGDRARIKTVWG